MPQTPFTVLLHKSAIDDLGKAIDPYLVYAGIGPHLRCRAVEFNGPFLLMSIDHEADGRVNEVELHLPLAYVKMIMSGDTDRYPGFRPAKPA